MRKGLSKKKKKKLPCNKKFLELPVDEELLKDVYFTARLMTLTTRVSSYGSYIQVKNGLCRHKCINTHTHAIEKSARWQHMRACLHIFIGMWRVARLSCPLASFRTRLPEMSHWILNMWTNLMMAGTQRVMALIIQPFADESWRPPRGLRHLPLNLLTPISLRVFVFHVPLFQAARH